MCYSAQCWTAYRLYLREFGAEISIRDFAEIYGYRRIKRTAAYVPRGMDANFAAPETDDERTVKTLIDEFKAAEELRETQDLFKQRKRLSEATRKLQDKPTKKAQEDVRIATTKIPEIERRLAELRGAAGKDDHRIYPNWWALVMIVEDGRRVVRPMRYGCRLPGWTPAMDKAYDTYNARRDSIPTKGWKKLFGYNHAVIVVNRFYENVSLHDLEQRNLAEGEKEQNVVLEFSPRPQHDMLIACLYTRSRGWGDEPDFHSFAMITDEPPPEVAAAGHDRCIIAIKRENMDAWLNPDPSNIDALQAILEDKDRPYYEHRLAA